MFPVSAESNFVFKHPAQYTQNPSETRVGRMFNRFVCNSAAIAFIVHHKIDCFVRF